MNNKTNLYVALYFLVVHATALCLGVLYFSWEGLWLCLGLTVFFGLSITTSFHRYLTHGGFQTRKFIRYLLAVWGTLAGEGPPIIWVANHRKHHKYSDEEEDPHSPQHGFGHSHILWMTYYQDPKELDRLFRRYAKDLLREPFMRFLNRSYIWWHVAFAALTFAVGWLYNGYQMGLSFLGWGFFMRMCLVWHITWSVNSWTHVPFLGYRNYETADRSRNNPIVAILAQGEGWHNNHHAHPTCTWHGHRWWERPLDATGIFIWLMKKLRLVWNVKDTIPHRTEREH